MQLSVHLVISYAIVKKCINLQIYRTALDKLLMIYTNLYEVDILCQALCTSYFLYQWRFAFLWWYWFVLLSLCAEVFVVWLCNKYQLGAYSELMFRKAAIYQVLFDIYRRQTFLFVTDHRNPDPLFAYTQKYILLVLIHFMECI